MTLQWTSGLPLNESLAQQTLAHRRWRRMRSQKDYTAMDYDQTYQIALKQLLNS